MKRYLDIKILSNNNRLECQANNKIFMLQNLGWIFNDIKR